jgi:hypothetical protein
LYAQFHVKRPYADVLVTLEVYQENGEMVCGLRFIEGEIRLPPKAMRRAIVAELQSIEQAARESGCTEMRHAGDDRAWCLPGYEPMPELRNGRRKRL